jgi:arylsulfatase A-like enzyme
MECAFYFGFCRTYRTTIAKEQIRKYQNMKHFQRNILVTTFFWLLTFGTSIGQSTSLSSSNDRQPVRPNILWVIVEDMSADFACYGQKSIETPNVDALAKNGTRFSRAFVTAPICSISRSALITGRYQTSIGAQNHRSSVPGHTIELPPNSPLVPALMRSNGYHTNNLTLEAFLKDQTELAASPKVKVAKTDYNFEWDEKTCYDDTHWSNRAAKKPFFVQIQLNGGKLRGNGNGTAWPDRVRKDLGSTTSSQSITIPPYLAADPVILEDWAQYLDTVRYTDWELGRITKRLIDSGDLQNTVIFFMTDHGISHIRNKQFLYDGGTHVPLIISGPGIASHAVREDLVEHIDLAATTLALANIDKPATMQSKNILASDYTPRRFVFAARDRADETVDLIRSVRDDRWKYIYNGFPNRPYLQPNNYKDNKPIVQAMRRLFAEGKLDQNQSLILANSRPREELYDTHADPYELNNLAQTSSGKEKLAEFRKALAEWQSQTNDLAEPESEAVYLLETIGSHPEAGRNTEDKQYQANVQLMIEWRTSKPFMK